MPNLLEYTEIWTKALDQQVTQQATSGWMESNAGQVQYTGGKYVKVPTLSMTGLGNYQRGTGSANRGKYAQGTVELGYETYELTQDRSAEFAFDRMDVDETGFIITAPAVMGEFQRDHVIPEIDSFRYSRIYKIIDDAGLVKEATLAKNNILDTFLLQVREMQDKTGLDTGGLIATMPFPVYSLLERSAEVQKQISVQQFAQGGVNFEVKSINGIPLIPVMSERFYSEYDFYAGPATLGFAPKSSATLMNWIICPRSKPIALAKTDNLKVFTPDTNQNGDDWLMQYRKYHDLWIMKNQTNQFIVCVPETPVTPEP